MRRVLSLMLFSLLLGCGSAWGRGEIVRHSVEWGIDAMFFSGHHYNYICEEGYRIDDKWDSFSFHPNASVQFGFGFNLTGRSELMLFTGYTGIGPSNRVIPLSLRYTFIPKGNYQGGLFYFADLGVGFHPVPSSEPPRRICFLGKLGFGNRIALSRFCSMDFIAGIRTVHDFPRIKDPDSGKYLSKENTRKSILANCALTLSIAFNF